MVACTGRIYRVSCLQVFLVLLVYVAGLSRRVFRCSNGAPIGLSICHGGVSAVGPSAPRCWPPRGYYLLDGNAVNTLGMFGACESPFVWPSVDELRARVLQGSQRAGESVKLDCVLCVFACVCASTGAEA